MDDFVDFIIDNLGAIVVVALFVFIYRILNSFQNILWDKKRKRRRDYYRNVYLKSDAWRRKRYVVLKRDNWTCQYCGKRATQVHHTRYAKYNIGKKPIKWLESECKSCHDDLH